MDKLTAWLSAQYAALVEDPVEWCFNALVILFVLGVVIGAFKHFILNAIFG